MPALPVAASAQFHTCALLPFAIVLAATAAATLESAVLVTLPRAAKDVPLQ